MVAGTLATYGLTVQLPDDASLTSPQRFDIACFEFLAWWWLAYFVMSYRVRNRAPRPYELFTLRSYLDHMSSHRGPVARNPPKFDDDDLLLRDKASSSRDVQGIMIAVVVLILTLVVINTATTTTLTRYQHVIRTPIFLLSLVMILLWTLSLDVFDTILNSFQVSTREAYTVRRWFYGYLGPFTRDPRKGRAPISGGVSYGYVGHALLPIFTLMVFSWFEPNIVGFATALYVFCAYPYYYGYWAVEISPERVTREMVKGTELRVEDWDEIADGVLQLKDRWRVNRDGDLAARLLTGVVPRTREERPHPSTWPCFVLGLGLLVISVVVVSSGS